MSVVGQTFRFHNFRAIRHNKTTSAFMAALATVNKTAINNCGVIVVGILAHGAPCPWLSRTIDPNDLVPAFHLRAAPYLVAGMLLQNLQ
jgi:hypothetical protein